MSTTETVNLEETTPIIPKTCKAGVVVNPGPDFSTLTRQKIEVQDIPVPEIGPEEVLIKLNVTGLCMSDVHFMMEDWGMPPMSQFGTKCAGHEGAGVIVKVGERVKNLKVGQRAGLKPIQDVCHTCEYCKTGRETYCLSCVMTGLHIDGSYKQYIVSPERYTSLIPDGVPDEIAGPIMCSGSTAYTSIKESGLRPGQWAVFPGGGGGVGMQAVQLAIAMGLRAIVIDTGAERKETCLKYGADEFIDFKEVENPVEKVLELTGGGAHAVFVTAVQSYPIAQGFLGHRAGAQVMCIGLPPAGKYNMEVNPSALAFRNQSIKGTLVAGMADVDETMDFARRGKLRLEPTVVGLSKFNESVQKLKNGQVAGRIVVDFNKE
ncbi:alcohol dehydrogenase [Aureobasidium pullulans]|nr:alcohol dehydrogenase [Aureobasidium pullulans]THW36700.1 alcohol dehydrogenase [Aureobasidium pullulans]THX05772.1 alcohol dehydrogenase [Aureobasidium pullulans]THZ00081.1 alcohol dehydrogenase [Aureobasidium pullulans]TIA22060.1 alcohol dehydrogenase [Aureobasidium pullulans]